VAGACRLEVELGGARPVPGGFRFRGPGERRVEPPLLVDDVENEPAEPGVRARFAQSQSAVEGLTDPVRPPGVDDPLGGVARVRGPVRCPGRRVGEGLGLPRVGTERCGRVDGGAAGDGVQQEQEFVQDEAAQSRGPVGEDAVVAVEQRLDEPGVAVRPGEPAGARLGQRGVVDARPSGRPAGYAQSVEDTEADPAAREQRVGRVSDAQRALPGEELGALGNQRRPGHGREGPWQAQQGPEGSRHRSVPHVDTPEMPSQQTGDGGVDAFGGHDRHPRRSCGAPEHTWWERGG
jgi:hypothetical protein